MSVDFCQSKHPINNNRLIIDDIGLFNFHTSVLMD